MQEGAWPVDVLINWGVPLYLYNRNYEYSIKVDYDILCVDSWDIPEILPTKELISAAFFKCNLFSQGFNKNLLDKFKLDRSEVPYFNAGFAVINNKEYIKHQFFEVFLSYYQALTSYDDCKIALVEQVSLALTIWGINTKYKTIPQSYNHRVTTFGSLEDLGTIEFKNIHYLTSNKPWKPINLRYLDSYVKLNFAHLYMFRKLWIDEAYKIPESKFYLKEDKMTELDNLKLMLNIISEIYENSKLHK